MIKRTLAERLKELFKQFPVVTLIGPRQSGKTTLIRKEFSNLPYYNLEDPKVRLLAQNDPEALFAQMPHGGIFDEIQRVPELLSYIQVISDAKNKPGQFIISGSHQFFLMKAVTQSLAGRTAILHLLPLSLQELQESNTLNIKEMGFEFFIRRGFYPRLYSDSVDPVALYGGYFETYIERDVRELIHIKDLSLFRKFLYLCAGRIGQVLNKESLARDTGISAVTVEQWISVLEASFILFRLHPYHVNLGKRVIKSPKLYFYDVGLASYLLSIEEDIQVFSHPLKGNLFENMIIVEAMKYRMNQGKKPNITFYRDAFGNEVDLVFERGAHIFLAEIKSSQTFHKEFYAGMDFFKKNKAVAHADIIYGGTHKQEWTQFHLHPWYDMSHVMRLWEDFEFVT